MMMRQAILEAFFLLALSTRWCNADSLYALMRNKNPENPELQVRGRGSITASDNNDSEARDLADIEEISEFWEDGILMIQSLATAPPTIAPSSSPTSISSEQPTASPSPSSIPSSQPTPGPTPAPTVQPTVTTTDSPTVSPVPDVSTTPTLTPIAPTTAPIVPTSSPVEEQSAVPTAFPVAPTASPVAPTPPPVTTFLGILSLQDSVGVCSVTSTNGIGCSVTSDGGMAGNPNDLVNCFDVTDIGGSAPFSLDTVRFWIGTSNDLPPDLRVRIWSSVDGSPDALLQEEAIPQFTSGVNTFDLGTPAVIESNEFCVGVSSQDPMGGLRIQNEDPSATGGLSSFVLSPQCGVTEFTTLQTLTLRGSLCIEAFISI